MSKRSYSRNALPLCQKGIRVPLLAAPPPALILVKTHPQWLGSPVPKRLQPLRDYIAPIRKTHGERVSLHCHDTAFHSARVTDGCIGNAHDHHACERVIDTLRETPFRDRCFDIVEILPGVENVYAANGEAAALPAVRAHAGYRRDAGAAFAQSFFLRRPLTKTTVATCGTTVVVRDSTVTLWA
ncbi:darcynin family protein [Burkholderia lata]|uniref:darcynin family protein n=1 Tax=Burkholderia lata (strain ATCC 17760 / DSM 23089 / LMG 22485 / NCIMB 9086 / R18194 / 383) TaxID=482957 RepID=UPI001581F992|nr:darcynin family protein [Burkholderia lata]